LTGRLPIAIILAFIPMWWMNLTSNIMSLGGIAIAIGAMVDSAIIMIENAHKALEQFRDEHRREPNTGERAGIIIGAAKSVGRSLFFALLVITVSFIPVFSLTAQEGRLFKPLAFTKTFSMFFAAFLGVTLVPVLMVLLIRGKITPEKKLNGWNNEVHRPASALGTTRGNHDTVRRTCIRGPNDGPFAAMLNRPPEPGTP
jgi:Cu(I)/Ag(I) efflux system membrane protein CusA/SilA